MNSYMPDGFFAYPSNPPTITEYVHTAINHINKTKNILIKPWDQCLVGGKLIIHEICSEINKADVFCADLTGLNANVMFELGYAISKDKRIWLSIDKSLSQTKMEFDQLKIMTTVGYADCCNSNQIIKSFLQDAPYVDLEDTILRHVLKANDLPANLKILYLKSRHNIETSVRLSNALDKHPLPVIVDDPRESAVQSLTWYASRVLSALGVVCHLTNPEREGARLDNARHALVAGMAYGMEKPLLMITEDDFLKPLDYRDIVKQCIISSDAERFLSEWIEPLVVKETKEKLFRNDYAATVRLAGELKGLQLGEHIAENEADQLVDEYFVETSSYNEALIGRHVLFVGRKGSGKTANLLKLSAKLESDHRNVVCVIKPVAYELDGILKVMNQYRQRDAKGYMLESLWKFLLYSELAKKVVEVIEQRAPGATQNCETKLISLMEQNHSMLREDFVIRLERCIKRILKCDTNVPSSESYQVAISEALHKSILRELRIALGDALSQKHRVTILVDNLDKAWDKTSDIPLLSEFMLGLLGTAARLKRELIRKDSWRNSINANLVVFLRSDIFKQIKKVAREPDKIPFSRITWSDPELLIRVLEERFVATFEDTRSPEELWNRYFCPRIHNIPVKEYLVRRCLPRPRDLLFFVNAAITEAVNRKHTRVEENDIIDAEKQYSQYALETLLVENGTMFGNLEEVLYEFAGSQVVVTRDDVRRYLKKGKIQDENVDHVIDHLCVLTFLGVEVTENDFRFAEDDAEHQRNAVLARNFVEKKYSTQRYTINRAFHAFLEINE